MKKNKIRVDWMWWTSLFRSHGWIFGPVLVPEVVAEAVVRVGGVLVREVPLLREVGPREERQQPVEIDHFEPVCLDDTIEHY